MNRVMSPMLVAVAAVNENQPIPTQLMNPRRVGFGS
jgi:hypothetical protein